VDIIISRSLIRMFRTEDHGRGGHDSQSYGEEVYMQVPSPGATVHTQSQEDRHEYVDVDMKDAPDDVDMTDAPDVDVTVHTQSQEKRKKDADVVMLDAAVIDATSCMQTDDLDSTEWTPTGTPEEEIALEMEAYRKMRVAKWVETECLWQSTRGA
jgi:hypothetical protein